MLLVDRARTFCAAIRKLDEREQQSSEVRCARAGLRLGSEVSDQNACRISFETNEFGLVALDDRPNADLHPLSRDRRRPRSDLYDLRAHDRPLTAGHVVRRQSLHVPCRLERLLPQRRRECFPSSRSTPTFTCSVPRLMRSVPTLTLSAPANTCSVPTRTCSVPT